jgi:hypothetical protein
MSTTGRPHERACSGLPAPGGPGPGRAVAGGGRRPGPRPARAALCLWHWQAACARLTGDLPVSHLTELEGPGAGAKLGIAMC